MLFDVRGLCTREHRNKHTHIWIGFVRKMNIVCIYRIMKYQNHLHINRMFSILGIYL